MAEAGTTGDVETLPSNKISFLWEESRIACEIAVIGHMTWTKEVIFEAEFLDGCDVRRGPS